MLKFKNLSISIKGTKLFGINELNLDKGLYALVGRNGTGKTTFLNSILRAKNDFSGTMKLDNQEISEFSNSELAKKIAVVFTKPQIFGNHTVLDVLALGRIPYQSLLANLSSEDIAKIESVVSLLELESLRDREFNTLSDGERQMVMIGRALVQDTDILILDEPGAFLDVVNRYKLIELLARICKESDKLILFSTHHIDMLKGYCNGVMLISESELTMLKASSDYETIIRDTFNISMNK